MPKSMAVVHDEGGHDRTPRPRCPECKHLFTGGRCAGQLVDGSICGRPTYRTPDGGISCVRASLHYGDYSTPPTEAI